MYLEFAKQWLKSNGYSTDMNLYIIRRVSKDNKPLENLVKKTNIFEIYLKPQAKKFVK